MAWQDGLLRSTAGQTAGALEGIMLAGSMIRNTNWTRVNAQLIKWTGGDTGTWA